MSQTTALTKVVTSSAVALKGGTILQHMSLIHDFLKEHHRAKEEIARINGQLDLLKQEMEYRYDLAGTTMDRIFEERRNNFNAIFNAIDAAIKSGQSDVVLSALSVVENLATSSPMKDMDIFKKAISSGRTIEI